MKTIKSTVFCIALILILTACSAAPTTAATPTFVPPTEEPTEIAASATPEPTETSTPEPSSTPTDEPTDEPTEEPASIPLEEPVEASEPEINARFVPAYPDNNFYIDSDIADDEWKQNMDGLARNQAIPKPYEWQLVGLPDETKWSDIFPYFKEYLLEKGWTITADGGDWVTLSGGNTMYVGGFIKTVDGKKEKISILFYPKSKQYDSHYRVFYSERK